MCKSVVFLRGGEGMKCVKFAHSGEGCSCYISFTFETTERVLTDFVCGDYTICLSLNLTFKSCI